MDDDSTHGSVLPSATDVTSSVIPVLASAPQDRSPRASLPSLQHPSPLQPALTLESPRQKLSEPPSRAPSPRSAARSGEAMTPLPAPTDTDEAQMLGPGVPRDPESNRPLNVTDALSYLDAVKMQFADKPDVYNHFLDIMKDFKSQVIDTPGVIERVSMLFHSNPYLIQGFNTFLPQGYRIDVGNMDTITVTTPMGTMTQNISAYGAPVRMAQNSVLSGSSNVAPFPPQPPFGLPPPPVLPVGIGNGSRPATPSRIHAHSVEYSFSPGSSMFAAPMVGPQATAAASFLGNLNNRGHDGIPPGEFNHAIQFLNKIKIRFEDDTETYKQFLEILHAYQKEQKQLHDTQVYAQVQKLFKDAPDLMSEFRDFLPEAMGPSAHAGLVGILPHPPGGSGAWPPAEASSSAPDKTTKAPRRKRPVQKAPPTKSTGGRAPKRLKQDQKPEPQSPKFAPFPAPPTPPITHHVIPAPQHPPPPVPHLFPPSSNPVPINPTVSTPEELLFFDRTKKALESGGTYEEFLKLLNLFAKDIIDTKTLIERAEIFLGSDGLMSQFKELMGWDEKHGNVEHGPPGSVRAGPLDPFAATAPSDGQGPSYRRLPPTEIKLACSGRRQLEWSVLNDVWVSHPTFASEESGFVAHKKNSFEDTLHRSEEERHEYQVYIEGMTRTIAILEPLDVRIDEMLPEERAQFRLKPGLGGTCPAIYEKTIKRVYGREHVVEIMRALQECPAVAVPVVLKRLKQKDEEWRRAQREWSKTWREVDGKNFYKALDHQGIVFKANDKKNITAKHFVHDIESIKASQLRTRNSETDATWARGSLGHQLEYDFQDVDILRDCLKLIFSFLDHSASTYSPPERRSVERFLRSFIPTLFMLSAHEFNATFGSLEPGHEDDLSEEAANEAPDDTSKSTRDRGGKRQPSGSASNGVSAGDLRKRLLKTAQERSPLTEPKPLSSAKSTGATRSASPTLSDSASLGTKPKSSRLNRELDADAAEESVAAQDTWIRESSADEFGEAGDMQTTRQPFFANTTFYTFLRLLQLLYSRLAMCKEIGAQLAAEKHSSLLANPVAVQLGLDEPNGPAAVLSQAIEAVGEARSGEQPNVLYLYLLDACEKVFDSEMDQATFEEHVRWFFGTKAYQLFTLDKVIVAIVKQVQTIMADHKCQELWTLLQKSRGMEVITAHDTVRYRREGERHMGSDDNLYRIDWERKSKMLFIQLLGTSDPSVEEDRSAVGRWREYVATYVMEQPTEWLPAGRGTVSPLFLRRCTLEDADHGVVRAQPGMRVVVRAGTYKLLYEAGAEDVLWRERRGEEMTALRRQAAARQEERRRWLGRAWGDSVGAASYA